MMIIVNRLMRLLLSMLTMAIASWPAFAQEDSEHLRITRAEFEEHAQALDFTPAQRDAAEKMFARYGGEFDDGWKTYNDLGKWLWTNTSSSSWYGGEIAPAFYENRITPESRALELQWNRGARALESRYFDELRRIAFGREDAVEMLRRKHLRERLLRINREWSPAGSDTDLIALLQRVDSDLSVNLAVQTVLNDYEMRLNEELLRLDEDNVTRRDRLREALRAMRAAEKSGKDATALRETFVDTRNEWSVHCNALWQLNASTAQRVASTLPPEQRTAFRDALFPSLFAFLYPEKGPTPDAAFSEGLKRRDLSPDQRTHLEQMRAVWRVQRDAAVPQLQRMYMRSCDPVTDREILIIYHSGHSDDAMARWNALEETWREARQQWLAKCDETLNAIKTALNDGDARVNQPAADVEKKP